MMSLMMVFTLASAGGVMPDGLSAGMPPPADDGASSGNSASSGAPAMPASTGANHDALCEKLGVAPAYRAVAVLLAGRTDVQVDGAPGASRTVNGSSVRSIAFLSGAGVFVRLQ